MRVNGFIDGNAPPFIVLFFILTTVHTITNVLKEVEVLPGGVSFKVYARIILYMLLVPQYANAVIVCYRIYKNGISRAYDFRNLDFYILISVLSVYTVMIICSLITTRIQRKYQKI